MHLATYSSSCVFVTYFKFHTEVISISCKEINELNFTEKKDIERYSDQTDLIFENFVCKMNEKQQLLDNNN